MRKERHQVIGCLGQMLSRGKRILHAIVRKNRGKIAKKHRSCHAINRVDFFADAQREIRSKRNLVGFSNEHANPRKTTVDVKISSRTRIRNVLSDTDFMLKDRDQRICEGNDRTRNFRPLCEKACKTFSRERGIFSFARWNLFRKNKAKRDTRRREMRNIFFGSGKLSRAS